MFWVLGNREILYVPDEIFLTVLIKKKILVDSYWKLNVGVNVLKIPRVKLR